MTLPSLRQTLSIAVLGTSIGLLAACDNNNQSETSASGEAGNATETASGTLAKAQQSGTLRVGYANEAPFAYMDSESGQLTGEAPEVLRHITEELGIDNIEGVLTEFGSLIPGLQAERFDVIAAGMYITPARCEQVLFSNPTYGIGSAFIVAEGNPKELHSFEDIANHDDATLGVVVGAIESDYAANSDVPASRVVVFPDAASAMAGVQSGRVDAYAATALTVNDLLQKDAQGVERADPFTDPVVDGASVRGHGAFAFRQSDAEMRNAFNDILADYLGTDAHLQSVEPFGFTAGELPGDVTAEQLCAG